MLHTLQFTAHTYFIVIVEIIYVFQVESLGKILDLRNPDTCPSFKNLIKKPAAELQALCISAIQKQITELIAAEGADTRLELQLRYELKQLEKIDTERADRKIGKFL